MYSLQIQRRVEILFKGEGWTVSSEQAMPQYHKNGWMYTTTDLHVHLKTKHSVELHKATDS